MTNKLDSVLTAAQIQELEEELRPPLDSVPETHIQGKKHGGKRVGAGRPKDEHSIRGQLRTATESDAKGGKRYKHSYTMYEIRSGRFVMERAHVLVTLLQVAVDKRTRALNTRGERKTLLSLKGAVDICRLDKDKQVEALMLCGLLQEFVRQYKDDDDDFLGEKAKMLDKRMRGEL